MLLSVSLQVMLKIISTIYLWQELIKIIKKVLAKELVICYYYLRWGHRLTDGSQNYGSLVKRSRHRPFTAVTRVRFP